MLNKVFIYTLFLFLIGCNSHKERFPHITGKVGSVKKELVLHNEKNDSDSVPLVSVISLATTDNNNNIYIADPRTLKIHSFNTNLNYRWTAGGKGRGPQMFNSISALYAGRHYLYVYDFTNSVMNMFSLNGNHLDEWLYNESGHRINDIRRMNNQQFVVTGLNEKNETLVHVYSDDFKKNLYSFVTGEEVFQTEHPDIEKQVIRSYPGYILPVSDSTMIYAPAAYNGRLLKYKKISPAKWVQNGVVYGYDQIENPLILHFSAVGHDKRSQLSGFNPKGGYFHAEFISMSRGLYKLENRNLIVHMSIRLNENDQWDLIIEYFDPGKLKLEDFTTVKNLIPSQQLQRIPIWMDQKGRVYMSQNSDEPMRILNIASE